MIRRATAVRYDRTEGTGRNFPLRVAARTDDGVTYDTFLKPSGRPSLGVVGMACEAVAAMLAADLRLPVCEPLLVEIDAAFVGSIKDHDAKSVLQISSPVCFASIDAGSGWIVWTVGEQLLSDRVPTALAIAAFDAFIENPDRTHRVGGKANLFVRGSEFRVFDHELALRVRALFPKPTPWQAGYLNNFADSAGHVLASKLKKIKDLDFAPIKDAWVGLSDARLDAYLHALPPEWVEARPAMEAAVNHIREVRDRIDECIAELSRVLR